MSPDAAVSAWVEIDRSALHNALTEVGPAVPTRYSASGGQFHVGWVAVHDGSLRIEAIQPGWSITSVAEGAGEGRTECLAPLRLLTSIVDALPAGTIRLAFTGEGIRLGTERSSFVAQFRPIAAEVGPSRTSPLTDAPSMSFAGPELASALDHVLPVAPTSWRYPLEDGVAFTMEPDASFTVWTTDRVNTAVARLNRVDTGSSPPQPFVLNASHAGWIARRARTADRVHFEIGVARLDVRIGTTTICTAIHSRLPADHLVVTTPPALGVLRISRRTFATTTRRIGALAGASTIWFELGPHRPIARAQVDDVGQVREQFPADYSGPECEVGFPSALLTAMVDRLDDGTIIVEIGGPAKAVRIYSENRPENRYTTFPLITTHRPWLR